MTALGSASLFIQRSHADARLSQDGTQAYYRELGGYVLGLVLAFVLTGAAFATVQWSLLPAFWCEIAIGILAFAQVLVHFRFFLHVSPSDQNPDDLHVALFSSLILLVMIGGTIWILADLALRMH